MSDRLVQATAQAQAVVAQRQGEQPSLSAMLNQPWVTEQLQRQLGKRRDAGTLVRSVLTAIKNAPDLNRCDPNTVLGGMFMAAQLNLEIGGGLGQSYLIPRKDRNSDTGWSASFQVGYPGLIRLASNSGQVVGYDTIVVKQGDRFETGASSERGKFFDWQEGQNHYDPTAPIVGVIGYVWLRGSERPQWRYLTLQQIEGRRPDHTKEQTGRNGTYVPNTPWKTHYEAMCEKTAMIEALRFVPKSADLALAITADDQVVSKREGGDMTVIRPDSGRREAIAGPAVDDDPAPTQQSRPPQQAPQSAPPVTPDGPVDDTGVDPEALAHWEAQQATGGEFWSAPPGSEFDA